MPVYFADSSALVKRYVDEVGSEWVIDLFEPALGNRFYIAQTTPVEIIASVTRRAQGGAMTRLHAATARGRFHTDLRTDYQLVGFSDALLSSAMSLAEVHALRGFDAVQLATAVEVYGFRRARGLPGLILVSADLELNAAAVAEGLQVEDPNRHP